MAARVGMYAGTTLGTAWFDDINLAPVAGPAPGLASVLPFSGGTVGGEIVTLSGTNLMAGATVAFGSAMGTGVKVSPPTTLTVSTPAHTTGPVDVTVINPDGQSATFAGSFNYVSGSALLHGTVGLQGGSAANQAVRITLYQPGTRAALAQASSTTGVNGDFDVQLGVGVGTYDVEVKTPRTLSVVASDLNVSDASPRIWFGPMLVGDTNDNNRIDIFDYNAVVSAFGSKQGDSRYQSIADLDGNGRVDIFDYNLLVSNFGKTGPLPVSSGPPASLAGWAPPTAQSLPTAAGRLYVSNYADNTVSVLDSASGRLVGTIGVGAGPAMLAIHAGSRRPTSRTRMDR